MTAAERNHRLDAALLAAGLAADDVARRLEVDPRTVRHWLAGRTPYPRHQGQLARLLGQDAQSLWPRHADHGNSAEELVAMYTHRADVPPTAWRSRLDLAHSQIDLLGYAMLFLVEMHPGLIGVLRQKGAEECTVRIDLVDHTSQQAADRDTEEQLSEGLLARVRTALRSLSPLQGSPGVELRQHHTPMYNSLFRFDEEMFVTPHLYRGPGYAAPLLHLRHMVPDGVFDAFAGHFERVWQDSTSAEAI